MRDVCNKSIKVEIAIIGAGVGGCAAALSAARLGCKVVLTEESYWIGGQLTNEMVPPDEHPWIENRGATASYRALRNAIRTYYRKHLPLTRKALHADRLNPGNGWVSKLCHDPRVSLAVLNDLLAPYLLNGQLLILTGCRPIAAELDRDRITSVALSDHQRGHNHAIEAQFFIDATPLGDLLALTGGT